MSVQPAPRRLSVEEHYRMAEAGILDEDDRVELLEGEVVSMAPVGSRHATCVRRIGRLLSERLGQQVIVSIQNPLRLDRHSEPQPDVVVLERGPDEYARAHPGPAEVLLLVEVADTTATYDRRRKIPVYAAAAIPEVWLVDLDRDVIDVYCRPQGGSYQESSSFGRGEVVRPLRLPELAIELGDILPPA